MKKALRIIAVILIAVVLIATIIISTMPKAANNSESIWDEEMTMGNIEAKNYFIIYSDLACPYCIVFENAIVEHEEEFKDYINKNDILIEVRLSDFLFEYGTHEAPASRLGAIATYCAKKEGKFWDFYNASIQAIAAEYQSYGTFMSPGSVTDDFWITISKKVGVSKDWKSCYENNEPLSDIIATARKTVDLVDGMPFFKFNKYTFSGFNPNGNWEDVKMHLDAGLKKK